MRQVKVDLFAQSVMEGSTIGAEVAEMRQLIEVILSKIIRNSTIRIVRLQITDLK